jgi:hypothetical protein
MCPARRSSRRARADGFRRLSVRGIESEADLPFAGLGDPAQAIGQRQYEWLPFAYDHDPVQLQARARALQDRLARVRDRDRGVECRHTLAGVIEADKTALPTGIGRLEHGGKADCGGRRARLLHRCDAREPGLRYPCSARRVRIATSFLITHAVSEPIPGRSSASATAATTGTARSAATVITPSTAFLPPTSITTSTSGMSTTTETSASCNPEARSSPSTATTQHPSARACAVAACCDKPAPTNKIVGMLPASATRP